VVHDWFPEWLKRKHKYAVTEESWGPEEEFHALAARDHSPVIHQCSTFQFQSVKDGARRFVGATTGQEKPYARIYTRLGNPTTEHLERTLFHLECQHLIDRALAANEKKPTIGVLVAASGMGAISVVLFSLLKSGDAIIAGNVYGCTDSILRLMAERLGIDVIWTDMTDLKAVEKALDSHPSVAAVYVESPDNPTLGLADIRGLATLTEPRGVALVVDNTFATPFLQQPFRLGADIVVHSLTKYVNGHSSGILGACLGPWDFINNHAFAWYKDLGVTPSPFESWQNSLHIKTLGYRVREASLVAHQIADWLQERPEVSAVHYPGLESHRHHEFAEKQMRLPGAMIAFEMAGGFESATQLMNHFARRDTPMDLTVSLGSTSTYIQHPASMTHAGVPEEERRARGITDGLVRVSIGLEGFDYLCKGFVDGFEKIRK
jgi:methionine-gamma-lyase